MNETNTVRHKGLRMSRVLLFAIIKIGIPVVFGIFVFIELFSLIEKKNIQAQEALITEESLMVEKVEEVTYNDNPLLEDSVPEINDYFNQYYRALADGDTEVIASLQDSISDTDKITIEKKAEYIEDYRDIKCYTKKGLLDDSYFAFVVSDVKFTNVEATAPAMTVYYLYTLEDGRLVAQGNMADDVLSVLPSVYEDSDVVDLFNKVDVSYTEAVSTDESLNTFLAELPSLLKTEVGEALAMLEASEDTEIHDDEVALASEIDVQVLSEEAASPVFQVIATDTVNVRKSDSEKADKIGKVSQGQVLTCLEEKINGWSRVSYEGKEAFIKSTYLERLTSAAEGEVIGTVKATTNVNVRSSASQEASKLGVAQSGSVYNLLEDLGEWYHIDYDGNNGYVKAEFFTK